MIVSIEKSTIRGSIIAPPSKSVAQRLILATVLTEPSDVVLRRLPECDDVLASIRFVEILNVEVEKHDDKYVFKIPEEISARDRVVDLGESGTTYRIALGIASTLKEKIILNCGSSMKRRPIRDLVNALRTLGAEIRYIEEEGYPPVQVKGPIKGGKVTIRGDVSSQFISSLIYAGLRSEDGIEIHIKPPIVSKVYLLLTIRILRELGGDIDIEGSEDEGYIVYSYPSELRRYSMEIPGDYALSAFIMAIAGICGEEIIIRGYNDLLNPVDAEIVQYFRDININIKKFSDVIYVSESIDIEPGEFSLKDNPDLVMPIVAVLSFAKGKSIIRDVKHLVHKESNRLLEIKRTLSEFNIKVNVDEERGIIEINPADNPKPGIVELPNDHRIAMMCSVVACKIDGKSILKNAECVKKSWPEYWNVLKKMGVKLEVY